MNKKNSRIPKNSSEIIELTIDSLSYNGGRGVGRYEGVVVFVPDTAPQDLVRARVVEKKPRFWQAELVEILKPSPARRTAPCPVFERCGGCSWQHINYSTQVEQKQKILKDSLRGLNKFGEFEMLPFLQAPQEFNYRNRIQVHTRGGKFGFFAKRSRDLVTFDQCLISENAINDQLKNLKPIEDGKTEIAVTETGEVRVMPGGRDPEAALFSQVNTAQNEALKKCMREMIAIKPEWIMDLYSGSGNLTFPLSDQFPEVPVLSVELSRVAVERGQALSKERKNLRWQSGDVEAVLHREKPLKGPGLVVLDPPRTGVSQQVVDELLRLRPQQIIYVSCNPSTFARDAERLVASGRFRLVKVMGVDMFPQTEHVELIASLCAAT